MVMARYIHRPLVTLTTAGAVLLASAPAFAQTTADASATDIIKHRPIGTISQPMLTNVAGWMEEGRAALKRNSFPEAIQFFRRVLACVENQYSAEAQELLGLSLQKSGQFGQARAVYEDYLNRYPNGDARERVKRSLTAIVAARDDAAARPRMSADTPAAVRLASASETVVAGSVADSTSSADVVNAVKNRSTGSISEANRRLAAASMDEGRAALKRNNFQEAITLFTRVRALPENEYSAEALELLGFARQKNGQPAEAKALYEDYLRRYPSGDGSERVTQRLAGIATAQDDKMAALRAPAELPGKALPIGKFTKTNETTWTLVGGISSFFIYDNAVANSRNTGLAPNVGATSDSSQTQQNEILTTLDLMATWNDPSTSGKIRFNGGYEHRFANYQNGPTGDQVDQFGVSQASIDVLFKDIDLRTVGGRQTLNGDGVFGRFDGALFSWQALPLMKIDLVGGTPANSRYNLPFGLSGGVTNQEFFGGGLGFGPLFGGLDASIYYNEEIGHWLVSREAIGTDLKFTDATKFAFVNIDYDVKFQQLNEAVLSGSWTLPNQSTIYGGLEYRRVPFLSTWNVLLNSTSTTLYDFLKAQTAMGQPLSSTQVTQLALAETPLYRSAMLGFSYPLNDKLTLSMDGTVANLSQNINAIAAALDPTLAQLAVGNEYYATAQLIATNIFTSGDMYSAAFHYAQQSTDKQYYLDFNTRYPVNPDLVLAPRLRLGYSQYSSGAVLSNNAITSTNLVQYTFMPSILVDYKFNPNLTFEAEVGTQYTYGIQPGLKTSDTELFATIGFRYNFDLDGSKVFDKSKPASPVAAALCRYTVRPDGTCQTSAATGSGNSQ
jgi:outer membrane protein assembly factor BamD (BamD/ComL family)